MFLARFFTKLILATFLVLLVGSLAAGQTDLGTGLPAFGSFNRDSIDTVNVGNLNVHFEFPVFAKKGRGLDFSAAVIGDNKPFRIMGSLPGALYWYPTYQTIGVEALPGAGRLTYDIIGGLNSQHPCIINNKNVPYYNFTNFVYTDSRNTTHPLYNISVGYPEPCVGVHSFSLYADNYLVTFAIDPTTGSVLTKKVTDKSGNVGDFLAGSFTDPNGNSISQTKTGDLIDTTGSTVMTAPPGTQTSSTLNFPNPTGGVTEPVVTSFSRSFTLKTNFGCKTSGGQNINELNSQDQLLTTGISLQDGTSFGIVYESTDGTYPSNVVTGRIHSLTLPPPRCTFSRAAK